MAERRRSRTLLAVLTLVALILITLDYRQGDDDGALAAVQRGALIVFAPIQEGFSQVVRPIGGFFSAIGELGSLRARNAQLTQDLEDLESQLPPVGDLQRENAELRALLRMRERYDLETTAARVIAHPPGERSNTVLVDAGGDDGIQSGMAVMSSQGLVGKVTVTTPRYAWVELLTSPTARYAVRVAETGDTGLLRGRGADPFHLELLEPETRAPEGAEVVTHTFQGSTIPDGLPVGEVAEADFDGQVSPRFHLVRPFVDFRRLSVVQIVLDAPEPPLEPDPDEVIDQPEQERPRPTDPDDPDDADGDDEDSDDEDSDEEDSDSADDSSVRG